MKIEYNDSKKSYNRFTNGAWEKSHNSEDNFALDFESILREKEKEYE